MNSISCPFLTPHPLHNLPYFIYSIDENHDFVVQSKTQTGQQKNKHSPEMITIGLYWHVPVLDFTTKPWFLSIEQYKIYSPKLLRVIPYWSNKITAWVAILSWSTLFTVMHWERVFLFLRVQNYLIRVVGIVLSNWIFWSQLQLWVNHMDGDLFLKALKNREKQA